MVIRNTRGDYSPRVNTFMEYQFEIRSDSTIYFTTARNYAEAIKFFKMSCGDLPIDGVTCVGHESVMDTVYSHYNKNKQLEEERSYYFDYMKP